MRGHREGIGGHAKEEKQKKRKRARVREAVERRDGGRERISVCAQIDSGEVAKYQSTGL